MRYLVLPFYDNFSKLHINDEELYNLYPFTPFRIYTRSDRLIPFIAPLSSLFTSIIIRTINGVIAQTITKEDIAHKVIKNGSKKFIVYDGGLINCLALDECEPYFIQVGNWYSELFWVSDNENLTKIELANKKSIGSVPYELGFKQWFWTDHRLVEPEQDTFQIQTKDEQNNINVRYSKITDTFSFEWYNVPYFIKEVLKSSEIIDTVSITQKDRTIKATAKQSKLKEKRVDGYATLFNLEYSITSDANTEDSYCSDSTFVLDSSYNEVIPTENLNCPPFEGIEEIAVNCLEDGIFGINTDCDYDFFAEVIYD
jgi:hypothetical protein